MHVTAVCCASFRASVKRAAGVEPLLSPPLILAEFDPADLANPGGLLYIKLHGLPYQPFLYGDEYITALSADTLKLCDLVDTVVFVASCHQEGYSPIIRALFEAGASAIAAGAGPNYAGRSRLLGADILGLLFRRLLEASFSPRSAFTIAHTMLKLGKRDRITRDTLQFKLYERTET